MNYYHFYCINNNINKTLLKTCLFITTVLDNFTDADLMLQGSQKIYLIVFLLYKNISKCFFLFNLIYFANKLCNKLFFCCNSEMMGHTWFCWKKAGEATLQYTFLRLQINSKMVSSTLYSKSSQLISSMFPFLSTVYEHPVYANTAVLLIKKSQLVISKEWRNLVR